MMRVTKKRFVEMNDRPDISLREFLRMKVDKFLRQFYGRKISSAKIWNKYLERYVCKRCLGYFHWTNGFLAFNEGGEAPVPVLVLHFKPFGFHFAFWNIWTDRYVDIFGFGPFGKLRVG